MRRSDMPLPVIPPLVLWALGALGAVVLAKLAKREHRRINEELEKARAKPVPESERANYRTLRRDPRTGVYREVD
jgi:cell division septation protein DedD